MSKQKLKGFCLRAHAPQRARPTLHVARERPLSQQADRVHLVVCVWGCGFLFLLDSEWSRAVLLSVNLPLRRHGKRMRRSLHKQNKLEGTCSGAGRVDTVRDEAFQGDGEDVWQREKNRDVFYTG